MMLSPTRLVHVSGVTLPCPIPHAPRSQFITSYVGVPSWKTIVGLAYRAASSPSTAATVVTYVMSSARSDSSLAPMASKSRDTLPS